MGWPVYWFLWDFKYRFFIIQHFLLMKIIFLVNSSKITLLFCFNFDSTVLPFFICYSWIWPHLVTSFTGEPTGGACHEVYYVLVLMCFVQALVNLHIVSKFLWQKSCDKNLVTKFLWQKHYNKKKRILFVSEREMVWKCIYPFLLYMVRTMFVKKCCVSLHPFLVIL